MNMVSENIVGYAECENRMVSSASRFYDREINLPDIYPVNLETATTEMILERLTELLEYSSQQGRDGHWAYSPAHHRAIRTALYAERDQLELEQLGGSRV